MSLIEVTECPVSYTVGMQPAWDPAPVITLTKEEIEHQQWQNLSKAVHGLNEGAYIDVLKMTDNPLKSLILKLDELIGLDWYISANATHTNGYRVKVTLVPRDQDDLRLHSALIDVRIGMHNVLSFKYSETNYTPAGLDDVHCHSHYFESLHVEALWSTPEAIAELLIKQFEDHKKSLDAWTAQIDAVAIEKLGRANAWKALCTATDHAKTEHVITLALGNFVKAKIERDSDYTTTTTIKATTKNTIRFLTSLAQSAKNHKKLATIEDAVTA